MLSLLCGYFVNSGYIMNNKIYIYGNNVLKTFFESFVLDVFNIKPCKDNNDCIYFGDEKLLEIIEDKI